MGCHVVVEERGMGAAGEAFVLRDKVSRRAALWTAESSNSAQHAVSLAHYLILFSELSKDLTLPVKDILLPGLCGLALKELLLLLLCLLFLSFKLLPELWVVRIAFPLFCQVLDVLVEQGRVILLYKLRLKLLPLHTHYSLSRLCALKSGEVRDISWLATTRTHLEVLTEIAAIVTIVSSAVIAPSDVNLLFTRTVTNDTLPQKSTWRFGIFRAPTQIRPRRQTSPDRVAFLARERLHTATHQ